MVVVDTESSGLFQDDGARISTVSWAYRNREGEPVARAMPFGQGQPNLLVAEDETDAGPEQWSAWTEWLSGQRLVFHNAAHDLGLLGAGTMAGYPGVDLTDSLYWDTMVAQRHLDPLEPLGLDAAVGRRLGLTKDDVLKQYVKKHRCLYSDVPWDLMERYAVTDARITLALYEDQQKRLAEHVEGEDWPMHDWLLRQMRVTAVLSKMEMRGIAFDAQECLLAAAKLEAAMKQVGEDLPFRPNSLADARRYYFGSQEQGGLALPHHKTTPGGAAAMDEEVRRTLVSNGAPHAAEFDRWCSLETALTMWYRAWPAKIGTDGRLRTRYRQTKVVSGRYSVERVQLQAIPQDYKLDGYEFPPDVPLIRSFFHPKPGHRLWEIDLSQAEVRVATAIAGEERMREQIASGVDAHDATTMLVFGVEKDHPDWKRLRSVAKRIRLGTIYGGGPKRIQAELREREGLVVPLEQVKEWIDADRRAFPRFQKASWAASDFAERYGYVELAAGGVRWFTEREMQYQAYHKAFNQRIQGSVAAVMDLCLIEAEARWPGLILLQTHDSLTTEEEEGSTVHQDIAALMCDTFEAHFGMPFVADIKEFH